MKPGKIVIVGGNAAGPAAAAKAKRINPDAEVKIFESGNFISTGTCEIPYVLSGDIQNYEDVLFYSPETFKTEKGVDVFTNHLVESINRKEKIIIVKNLGNNYSFELKYDKIILATGSIAKTLPNFPNDAQNVFTLKTISNLIEVMKYIRQNHVRNAAVIGSGYLGLEIVEALNKLNLNVSLIEKEPLPLPSSEVEISYLIQELIKNLDIAFYGNASNLKINYDEKQKKIISLEIEGRLLEFDIIFVAVGFTPNISLAFNSKIEIGKTGAIKVDNKLRTSDQNIFAAGDNIEVINAVTNRPDYIPLATIAHQHAHAAGENAVGGNIHIEPVIKNVAFKFFDKYFVSVGLTSLEAEKNGLYFSTVSDIQPNLVSVMPESSNVFGKIIYEKNSKRILGAAFLGGREVSGYGDLISAFIKTKQSAELLSKINFNYTPPLSPFINLLSVLGRMIK